MSVTARKQYRASDWPFWHPDVNPVAPETPPCLARALWVYLTTEAELTACMRRTTEALGPGRRWSCPALDAALAAERRAAARFELADGALLEAIRGRPGYHRSGDFLVSVVWRPGGERLDVKPAFTPLRRKGV